ncbi:MAG: hypothetical protein EBR30_23370 [Cytophagia bacterium]|nr:hypothetical protein [Cytophagia bacterium]
MRKLALLFCLIAAQANSQTAVLNNNPPAIKWQQVNTPSIRVIYPRGVEAEAQRVANTLEHIRLAESRTLGKAPRKINIILQNQSSISNAFVSLAPRRSEFFMMPSQNYNFLGSNDWLNLLAVHEYRHVVQFENAITGFNKLFYYAFGPATTAAMANIAVPSWFWEGDAVALETGLTGSGRGRIPNFNMNFRTNLLEGRTFNYKEMAKEYKARWEEELKTLTLTNFERVNARSSSAFTNYHYPSLLDNGSIVAMKSGIGDVDQLVLINNGVETRIHTQGVVNDAGMLSTANTKVVWNEYEFDPRYRVKTYSVIKAYDVATKQLWKLSSKSRYGAAALSPDGYQVVTVETNNQYQTAIVIIDFFSKQEKKRFENQENHFYAMPRFSSDGKSIVVTKTTPDGKTFSIIDIDSGLERDVLPITDENIGHPVLQGNILYFNSPVSGIDNIYAYDLKTSKRYQVTISKYGAFNPALSSDGKTLFYNDQGRDGLDVVKMPVDTALWQEVSFTKPVKTFFEFLAEQEGRPNLLDSIPQTVLSTKRYSKLSGIINPVSWGAYFDSNLTSTTLGITSRNILSTTAVSAGYDYNIAENSGSWNATVSYQGWLPIVDFSTTFTNRSVNEGDVQIRVIERNPTPPQDTTRNEIVTRNLTLNWEERNVSVGLRIPLLLTRSKYNSGLTISNNIGYTKVSSFTNSLLNDARFAPAEVLNDTITRVYTLRNYVGNNSLIFNRFRFNAFRYFRQSSRDFLPKWGQAVSLEWYKTGAGSDLEGSLFAFYTQLYLPGLLKHHSINGYWAFQSTLYTDDFRTNYTFPNRIPVPRGQSIFRAQKFYSMSLNYALPLWYPDINIGPLVNFQRLRMNAFVDYGFANSPLFRSSQSYLTVGSEVKLDINILRFVPQLDIGFRVNYGISPSVSTFEFLLGTINF